MFRHFVCAGIFSSLAMQRLAPFLDSGACGARTQDQLGLRIMEVRLLEETVARVCVCVCTYMYWCVGAHTCIIGGSQPFPKLDPLSSSPFEMSLRTFPFCLGVGFCYLQTRMPTDRIFNLHWLKHLSALRTIFSSKALRRLSKKVWAKGHFIILFSRWIQCTIHRIPEIVFTLLRRIWCIRKTLKKNR